MEGLMMNKNCLIIIFFTFSLSFQGCTTLNECNDLYLKTDPSGANYYVYDSDDNIISNGTTPAIVSLHKKNAPYKVTLSQQYRESKEFIIKRNFRPAYLGNILLIPLAFTGIVGLALDPPTRINPNLIETNLEYTPEGLAEKQTDDERKAEALRKEHMERQVELYKFVRDLTDEDDIKVVKIKRMFNISNPYAFDKDTVYYSTDDYMYVWQWIENAFIASFLPKAAGLQMPYNTEFYIRNVSNIKNINFRVSKVYLRYIGTQNFTNGYGVNVILPVFDLLYYEK
jgi:hypothetical protein